MSVLKPGTCLSFMIDVTLMQSISYVNPNIVRFRSVWFQILPSHVRTQSEAVTYRYQLLTHSLSLHIFSFISVMGQVMSIGTKLFSTCDSVDTTPGLREDVDELVQKAQKMDITKREQKHVDGIKLYADG